MDALCNWLRSKDPLFKVADQLLGLANFPVTGRGIIAKAHIPKGSLLLQIPRELCLSQETARMYPPLKDIFAAVPELSSDDVIALCLMHQRLQGEEAPNYEHIRLIPGIDQGAEPYQQTIFWTDEELDELKGSKIYTITKQLHSQLRSDYNNIVVRVFMRFPKVLPLKSYSYDIYLWALATIWSRAMDFQVNDETVGRYIVPVADMFNTDPHSEVCHFYNVANNTIGIMANKDYQAGEQVFINYGEVPNARLLQLHGFTIENNPGEVVELYAPLSPQVECFSNKLSLLGKMGVNPNQPHLLSASTPLPPKLLPSLRVQFGTEDILKKVESEALSFDSSVDPKYEGEILKFLESGIQGMLAQYPADSDTDSEEMGDGSQPQSRKKMAVILRHGEKAFLEKSLKTVQELLESL
ncbi:histone-lysine N-methyltransferase setd3 [Lingula anatina]|uniref:Histone-lysine N-methyltransferase setd3 n=1 Tax=Lingula anatina TaxID=7574 RepID=A0A1S3H5K2_LINAN|nr:histone-lysine N-methyltransferase setd3 [Lingula anatina]|eukprot:XP_013381283.1 histone-lysine N-methyltransferase setd3 [Lingula anatina]